MNAQKKYDITLFGATGFTGKITAEYLSSMVKKENFTWAIAGRNRKKLEEIKQNISGPKPDIIVADIDNYASLLDMTTQTRVIMNAAGPFSKYGKPVVKACLEGKTHYTDITGEPSFVADTYLTFDKEAKEKEVCIINCCGFDSIPADFGAFLTAQKLPKDEPKSIKCFIRTNATFSGGTLNTAIEAMHNEVKGNSIKVKHKKHPDAPKVPLKLHYNNDVNAWAIPMPVVDPHIVKRSMAGMPEVYGEAASYGQFFLRSSLGKTVQTIFPIATAAIFVRSKLFRDYFRKKFIPGTGPSEERRANSKFEVICFGKTATSEAKTIISGADPGYNETAKMFAQSAFTIIAKENNNKLNFGVLTPVQGLGMDLIPRLKAEGIHIE